ncbi:VOC family protein [Dyadobacter pollutisoli]|uniref:VOC family protein n=1 Tax=Dyadobacter pollutisoli TaxID=2910158 RepID=A0A9E8SRA4_9BACT|nr:VOC family protein [Dyadobacter pollutisoli]WAC13952.1 VOC family protein [Dyadobacter pollutisoli]
MALTQKITSNLWFDSETEDAARFYVSVFKNGSIGRITRYGEEGFEFHGKQPGTVMTIEFELEGQKFVGLNGGPIFQFNEAISFIIDCETQEEIDYYWDKLTDGGDPKAQQCGWLKDKFGVSWQVVPVMFADMVADPNDERTKRAMNAMFPMKKLDIAALEKAYNGA